MELTVNEKLMESFINFQRNFWNILYRDMLLPFHSMA